MQERREACKTCRKRVRFAEQSAQLVEVKKICPEVSGVYSQVLQDVLHRVDKSFQAFFHRGHGFPRFRSQQRYDSFTYPQFGFGFQEGKLALSKIGHLKIKLHREPKGTIKTLQVKREGERWYACFAVEYEGRPLPASDKAVGLDLGLESFAVTSDGEIIDNPRWLQQQKRRLRVAQRRVSRRKKEGYRWNQAVHQVRNIYRQVFHQRNDFQHQLSRELVNLNGTIVVEDLHVQGLAKSFLARSVSDAGWSACIAKLRYRAAEAGRQLILVDPRGTSQRCPQCGASVPKKLQERRHKCASCGWSTSRDHASAVEILRLGLSPQALSASSSFAFA